MCIAAETLWRSCKPYTKQEKFGKADHWVKWFASEGIDVCIE
jgi:hypothetical protein